MISLKSINLRELFVDEKPLDISAAVIIVTESRNGLKEWNVSVDMVDQTLLYPFFSAEFVELKMIDINGKKYSGKALTAELPSRRNFKGTGMLFGN